MLRTSNGSLPTNPFARRASARRASPFVRLAGGLDRRGHLGRQPPAGARRPGPIQRGHPRGGRPGRLDQQLRRPLRTTSSASGFARPGRREPVLEQAGDGDGPLQPAMGYRLPRHHVAGRPGTGGRAGVLRDWLRDLAAHGVTPEIAFKPDYNYQSRGRIMIPDLRTYEAAISAFTALYSNCPGTPSTCADGTARVRIIAPWGEPEFKGTSRAGTFHKLPQVFTCKAAAGSMPPIVRLTPPMPTAVRPSPRRCGSPSSTAARPAPSSPGISAATRARISPTSASTASTCATCTAATPSIARTSGPFTHTPTSSGSSVPFSSTGR